MCSVASFIAGQGPGEDVGRRPWAVIQGPDPLLLPGPAQGHPGAPPGKGGADDGAGHHSDAAAP